MAELLLDPAHLRHHKLGKFHLRSSGILFSLFTMVKTKAEGEGVCPCVCLGRADGGPCIGAPSPPGGGGGGPRRCMRHPPAPPPSREIAVQGQCNFCPMLR